MSDTVEWAVRTPARTPIRRGHGPLGSGVNVSDSTCSVDGCTNKIRSIKSGICNTHYRHQREARLTDPCEVEGCGNTVKTGKLCGLHYARVLKHGSPDVRLTRHVPESLRNDWEAVIGIEFPERPDGCWEWPKGRNTAGYGQVAYPVRDKVFAHRVSYALSSGPIPDEMTVDHLCFNPPCVRPDHLRLLTRSDNAARKQPKEWQGCGEHEPTPENTYRIVRSSGRIERGCAVCQRTRAKRYREANA